MSSPGGTGIAPPNEEREVYGRMAARPEHRKEEIGKALVAAAIAALKKERITKVALIVFSTNES
jgi:GNAT superfamily N-acetyltransferase